MQRRRILAIVFLLAVGFTAIGARLVWLQGFEWRTFHLQAEGFHRRVWTDPAPRGRILDRHGVEITLDEPSLRARGSFLGAGGIMVFDDSRDMVEIARQAMSFFAHESCGKCFPCRIGTQRLTERLAGEAGPREVELWKAEVHDIGHTMAAVSACGLGIAAPLITESLLRDFPEAVAGHLEARA